MNCYCQYLSPLGFALAQWYGVGLRFVRSRVRSPAPLSYNEITSGCCDLALAPYGRIHVVKLVSTFDYGSYDSGFNCPLETLSLDLQIDEIGRFGDSPMEN